MSTVIMIVMAALFIGGVYLTKHGDLYLAKRSANQKLSYNTVTRYGMLLTIVIPVGVGIVLLNFLIRNSTTTTTVRNHDIVRDKAGRQIIAITKPVDAGVPDSGAVKANPASVSAKVNEIRVVVSDDSIPTTNEILDKCSVREAVVIRNKQVICMKIKELEAIIYKTVKEHQTKTNQDYRGSNVPKLPDHRHAIQVQSPFPIMLQAAAQPDTVTVKKEESRPFKDRYAEVFYFLALVIGVLGKYYWDYSEEKAASKDPVPFDAHIIALAFVVACLVYYSIQQGIENEANKLTTRGVMFAFNSGFMWQTILKSSVGRRASPKRPPRRQATQQ